MNEDKSNDPMWTRHKVNKESTVLTRVTTCQGRQKKNSLLHWRRKKEGDTTTGSDGSGDTGEANHQFHLPQALGRGARGSGKDDQLTSLSFVFRSAALQCKVTEEPASKALWTGCIHNHRNTRRISTTAVHTSSVPAAIKHFLNQPSQSAHYGVLQIYSSVPSRRK